MRIEILGSAAGGGFPQWNCGCKNCRGVRAGTFAGKSRTQTQVAISSDNRSWFLLNASPDLRLQIEATSVLHPVDGNRASPIAGVVLTSGDVDQIAGLLSLRELAQFDIYCTSALLSILRDDNSVFAMLNRVPEQVVWKEIRAGGQFSLQAADGSDSGIACRTFPLAERYPYYVGKRSASLLPEEASLGLLIESKTGGKVAYLPAVPRIDEALLRMMEAAELVLFDGTFWTDDELIRIQGGATAQEMGHVPVGSPGGSLEKLAGLRNSRKVFVHVNNTNPMLDESSAEYQQVRDAGWEVAEDGWHFDL